MDWSPGHCGKNLKQVPACSGVKKMSHSDPATPRQSIANTLRCSACAGCTGPTISTLVLAWPTLLRCSAPPAATLTLRGPAGRRSSRQCLRCGPWSHPARGATPGKSGTWNQRPSRATSAPAQGARLSEPRRQKDDAGRQVAAEFPAYVLPALWAHQGLRGGTAKPSASTLCALPERSNTNQHRQSRVRRVLAA